ncbi:ubiquitin-like modifier-activating enzyme atg7 [Corchorus olitorius]|uniref:Ubiquitin-like modifier-activating enzyme atg7 n=1 Tax=Corchorus olitorius TaxID=93759 RepID=A0A1R3HZR7_9ROSI|nr:ubiquitin-like modifier-activating enzyme atg7 [Corchorus olitorius]
MSNPFHQSPFPGWHEQQPGPPFQTFLVASRSRLLKQRHWCFGVRASDGFAERGRKRERFVIER